VTAEFFFAPAEKRLRMNALGYVSLTDISCCWARRYATVDSDIATENLAKQSKGRYPTFVHVWPYSEETTDGNLETQSARPTLRLLPCGENSSSKSKGRTASNPSLRLSGAHGNIPTRPRPRFLSRIPQSAPSGRYYNDVAFAFGTTFGMATFASQSSFWRRIGYSRYS
jgi:hypothetical protein